MKLDNQKVNANIVAILDELEDTVVKLSSNYYPPEFNAAKKMVLAEIGYQRKIAREGIEGRFIDKAIASIEHEGEL